MQTLTNFWTDCGASLFTTGKQITHRQSTRQEKGRSHEDCDGGWENNQSSNKREVHKHAGHMTVSLIKATAFDDVMNAVFQTIDDLLSR
jgi:hypothetical protein